MKSLKGQFFAPAKEEFMLIIKQHGNGWKRNTVNNKINNNITVTLNGMEQHIANNAHCEIAGEECCEDDAYYLTETLTLEREFRYPGIHIS